MKLAILLFPLILVGCVHVNKGSANASREEIEAHLKGQLHCQRLELHDQSPDNFSGAGKNDTGEFTVDVKRKQDLLTFHGIYDDHTRGTFSGSAAWGTHANAFLGIHQSSDYAKDSLGTP